MNKVTSFIIMALFVGSVAGCGNNTVTTEEKHPDAAGHEEKAGKLCRDTKIAVSEESRKAMGLELKTAAYRGMEETLSVTGEIAKDTEKVYHLMPKAAGEVARIDVNYYDMVKQGDVLGAIKEAQETSEIVSPYSGIVTAVNVSQGQHVDEITSCFSISDLGVISANFDVYEKDAGKIKVGQKIKVKSLAYPDKTFTGKIVFISPRVDEKSRTIKVRADIDNSGYLLKFSMFVTGKIIISEGQFLSVSQEAVQKVDDKAIVFVSNGDKEFIAREIKPGFEDNGYVQVLAGIKHGDKIAVVGSFLLKSELLKAEMGEGCAE
ncbi:MAG: efflux RND transporter periplasmic adaptor subunit [Elusimicrobia bacterium]|nr:efflux RND transporter periplasmic adaptor subunit [Candidatus Liberimonas magnetica]